MKPLLWAALAVISLGACNNRPKEPLVGRWTLTSVHTTPAGLEAQAPLPGTIYDFRADSTLVIAGQAPRRYELRRLPEGMFLAVGDSPAVAYRIVAMTPAELGLQQDRGESLLNLKLQYQQ